MHFVSWFNSLIEVKNFGWNAGTISACFAWGFSLLCGRGVWRQSQSVWQSKSGQSISNVMFLFFVGLYGSMMVYGLHAKSLTLIINSLQIGCYISVALGLWRFKGFDKKDWVVATMSLVGLLAMVALPYKSQFFMLFSLGAIAALAMQPIELCRTKSPGKLSIGLILTLIASTIFWLVYAFATRDPVLMIVIPINFILFVTTALLWAYYSRIIDYWSNIADW